MSEVPETRYTKSGAVSVAYQVSGNGPLDMVVVPPMISHLEMEWADIPQYRRFYERLGRYCRVIRFDKRGMGMSDRLGDRPPTVEQRMDDVRAVMDAAGSERAVLLGVSEGGGLSALFCATYPERALSLAVFGATARLMEAEGYEPGISRQVYFEWLPVFEQNWGNGLFYASTESPSSSLDPDARAMFGRLERLSATPGAFAATMRMNAEYDVRYALNLVSVPTLVMHRRGEFVPGFGHGQYLADHIRGATFKAYPGADHFPWFGDTADQVVDDLVEFVTGEREQAVVDTGRILATVVFTDIVESTKQAAALGDRKWREVLDRHDELLDEQINRFQGRLVKRTGDGCLAVFDGPGRGVRCAVTLVQSLRREGITIRAGLHTGEVELRGDDIGGIGVHIGQRVSSLAKPGEVLVSRTVKDLVTGSGIDFADRGDHELKGVPGAWKLFAVTG